MKVKVNSIELNEPKGRNQRIAMVQGVNESVEFQVIISDGKDGYLVVLNPNGRIWETGHGFIIASTATKTRMALEDVKVGDIIEW